jgi:prophage regulatory protein
MNLDLIDPTSAEQRPHVILRAKQVIERTGLSNTTIYEMVKVGRFPRQIQLGARAVGWLESEINDFIGARAAERATK